MRAFTRTLTVVGALASAADPSAAQDAVLRTVHERDYERVTTTPTFIGGRVVISKYASDGNNEEIVAIDPYDGSAESLITPSRDARLVATDERYVVYSTRGSSATPIIVADRRTGQRLASVRLRDGVVWGHIRGDRLFLIQNGSRTAPALIYRLPNLELERTVEIAVARQGSLWGDKVVLLGNELTVYDLELNRVASANLPDRYPDINAGCTPEPLRVHGDLAIVGSRCYQVAVYDLSPLRIRYVLRGFSNYHGLAVIDDVLFLSAYGDYVEDVARAYELSTGRELARLRNVSGQIIAASGDRLLAMKRTAFSVPARVTVYEPALDAIRSDSERRSRVLDACTLPEPSNPHETIERCEDAGIQSYAGSAPASAEMGAALGNYARSLALTYSRFQEAIPILEKLGDHPDAAFLLALARLKSTQLAIGSGAASSAPDAPGVVRRPLDFGAFSNLIAFDGDRIYVARWGCSDDIYGDGAKTGVTLDALTRADFAPIERVDVVGCDDEYQDAISSITLIPGFIVLGLEYRYEDEDRTNVVVLAHDSLQVVAKGHLEEPPIRLREWSGRLLRCARNPGEPHARLDPATARLVEAASDEVLACLNGEVTDRGRAIGFDMAENPQLNPLFSTPRVDVFERSAGHPLRTYRFVNKTSNEVLSETQARQYNSVLQIPSEDAVVLGYARGREWVLQRFEPETGTEAPLFATNRYGAATVWRNYLFVAMERSLLTYDLDIRQVVYFERDFIRQGLKPVCPSCADANGIRSMVLDADRLIVLPLRGDNTRVVDLPTYETNFRENDFFIDAVRQPGPAELR